MITEYRVDYSYWSIAESQWFPNTRTEGTEEAARKFVASLLDEPRASSIRLYKEIQLDLGQS